MGLYIPGRRKRTQVFISVHLMTQTRASEYIPTQVVEVPDFDEGLPLGLLDPLEDVERLTGHVLQLDFEENLVRPTWSDSRCRKSRLFISTRSLRMPFRMWPSSLSSLAVTRVPTSRRRRGGRSGSGGSGRCGPCTVSARTSRRPLRPSWS